MPNRTPLTRARRRRRQCSVRSHRLEDLEPRRLLAAVTSVSPLPNTNAAPRSTDIVANFDTAINSGIVNHESFAVHSSLRGQIVDSAGTITVDGASVTLDPASDFLPGELVQASATLEIQSAAGDPIEPRVWEFRAKVPSGSAVFSRGPAIGGSLGSVFYGFRDGAAFGDVDGDGDLDVFVARENYQGRDATNRVWLNSDGEFTDSGQRLGDHSSRTVALGDLDRDGDLDAYVINRVYGGAADRIWMNDGGVFTDSGQILGDIHRTTNDVALGDVDGDGDLDVVLTFLNSQSSEGAKAQIWLNDDGIFQDSYLNLRLNFGREIELGDLDGDGDLDAFVADVADNRVWLNSGDPSFGGLFFDTGQSLRTPTSASVTVTLGDVDNDGDLDAFVGNRRSSVPTDPYDSRIWLNDGHGVFTDSGQALAGSVTGVTLGDLDGDGDLDALTATRTDGLVHYNQVWINQSGSFVDSGQALAREVTGGTVALGDVDADGDLDAIVASSREEMQIWLNEGEMEDALPVVTVTVNDLAMAEASGTATVVASLTEAASVDVIIDLSFLGSALLGTDYTVSANRILIPAGSLTGTVTITALQDLLDEPDETVIVEFTNVTNAQLLEAPQVVITIQDDDEPLGFVVTSFTPNASGFTAEFSAALDPSTLNVFDTQGAVLGAADVFVTGTASGFVAGSAVIDERRRVLQFIKTGAPLDADTYTVRLRSAIDGFRDSGGVLLDGDRNGTAGDDFVEGFTVVAQAAERVVVGLPDFVRGPGQETNLPANATTGIPVSISRGVGVRSVDVAVSYDPGLLTIESVSLGPAMPDGATISLDATTPGTATLTFSSSVDLPAAGGVLANLQASVPTANAALNYGTHQALELHSVEITDGNSNPIPAIADQALHLVSYFGDVSGNRRINAADAAQLARVAALLETGFVSTPLTDPTIVGDISGNRRINAADASLVSRFAALIPVPEIPPIPQVAFLGAGRGAPAAKPQWRVGVAGGLKEAAQVTRARIAELTNEGSKSFAPCPETCITGRHPSIDPRHTALHLAALSHLDSKLELAVEELLTAHLLYEALDR